jgi:hypothetical protein
MVEADVWQLHRVDRPMVILPIEAEAVVELVCLRQRSRRLYLVPLLYVV